MEFRNTVSILMPVKNASPWLEECIESIQNQTHTAWQLLAVDDLSTDDSWALLKKLSKSDHRITVIKNGKPGITDALQMAFDYSSGEYITRMDADDIMPPNKLETLLAIAKQNPNSIATGLVKYFGDEPISVGYQAYESWLNNRVRQADHKNHLFRECVLASPNWLTHRKNLEAIAPFAAHVYPEDYDLVFRWLEKGFEIVGINQLTHLWREHQSRTSRTSANYNQQHFFDLKLNWFLKLKYDENKPLVIFGENVKAEICKQYFKERNIDFIYLNKSNHEKLAHIHNPHLLCAVFDKSKTRRAFEAFFGHHDLILGEDWWYV